MCCCCWWWWCYLLHRIINIVHRTPYFKHVTNCCVLSSLYKSTYIRVRWCIMCRASPRTFIRMSKRMILRESDERKQYGWTSMCVYTDMSEWIHVCDSSLIICMLTKPLWVWPTTNVSSVVRHSCHYRRSHTHAIPSLACRRLHKAAVVDCSSFCVGAEAASAMWVLSECPAIVARVGAEAGPNADLPLTIR